MDLITFLGLPEGEQWEEFTQHSIFLARYEDIDVHQDLYRLHGFYVELSSAPGLGLDQVMNAFTKGPRLDKYMAGDLDYIFTDLEIDMP